MLIPAEGQTARSVWRAPLLSASIVLFAHILFQIWLNLFVPFSRLIAESGHDGSVYFAMADDPVPDAPEFTLKRYRRLFFPLVLRLLPVDHTLVALLVEAVAVIVAAALMWRVAADLGLPNAGARVLAASLLPWLFVSAHLGLLEPLILAFLVAGTWLWLGGRWIAAGLALGGAVLVKETAAIAVVALAVASILTGYGDRRRVTTSLASLVIAGLPAAALMGLLAWKWRDPLWFVSNDTFSFMALPLGLLRIDSLSSVVSQSANVAIAALAVIGLRPLMKRSALLGTQCALVLPVLVFFQHSSVYTMAFDFSRSLVLVWPLALVVPLHNRRWRMALVTVLAAAFVVAWFWALYFTKFFAFNKVLPWQSG